MNYKRTPWSDAVGQDVWVKLPDGTMEKLTRTGRFWVDRFGGDWYPGGTMPRLATPYIETTEAVEITLPEAVERAEQGLRVVDKDGIAYMWNQKIAWYFNENHDGYFIPAVEPETVEVTVTLPAASKEDFLKGVSAFAGAKVKEAGG